MRQSAPERVLMVGTDLRGRHYGQRPMRAAPTGRTHGRTDRDRITSRNPLPRESRPHMAQVTALRDRFEQALICRVARSACPWGGGGTTSEHLSVRCAGLERRRWWRRLRGKALSSQWARPGRADIPRPLLAMGISYEAAKSALRMGLSRNSTEDKLELALDGLSRLVHVAAAS